MPDIKELENFNALERDNVALIAAFDENGLPTVVIDVKNNKSIVVDRCYFDETNPADTFIDGPVEMTALEKIEPISIFKFMNSPSHICMVVRGRKLPG